MFFRYIITFTVSFFVWNVFAGFKGIDKQHEMANKTLFKDGFTGGMLPPEEKESPKVQQESQKNISITTNLDQKTKSAAQEKVNVPSKKKKISEEELESEESPENVRRGLKNHSMRRLSQEEIDKILKLEIAKITPKEQKTINNLLLGYSAMTSGYYEACVYFYNQALELDSKNYDAIAGRGVCYHKLNQYNEAFRDYMNYLRHNPNNKKIRANMISILSVIDTDSALEKAKILYESHRNHADSLYVLGTLYGKIGSYNEAVDLLTRAIRIESQNCLYYYNLGLVYEKMNNKKDALYNYKRARDLYSVSSGINITMLTQKIEFLKQNK